MVKSLLYSPEVLGGLSILTQGLAGKSPDVVMPSLMQGVQTASAMSKFQYGSGTGPAGGLTKGINKWIKQKKFQWKDKKTGRFLSYESMSFLIARSIYNKGLKANMFFTKPFEKGLERLGDDLFEAFTLDIENAIILGKKK